MSYIVEVNWLVNALQHAQYSDQRIDFKQFRKSRLIEVIKLARGGRILGFSIVQAPSLGHIALYSLDGCLDLESEKTNGSARKLKIGAINITDLAVVTTHKRIFDVSSVPFSIFLFVIIYFYKD